MALFRNRNNTDDKVDASQLASTLFLYIGAREWVARPPGAPLDGSKDLRGDAANNERVGVERIERPDVAENLLEVTRHRLGLLLRENQPGKRGHAGNIRGSNG